MKICKECGEPKFNFQMFKREIFITGYRGSYRIHLIRYLKITKYCKKCIKKLKKQFVDNLMEKENK